MPILNVKQDKYILGQSEKKSIAGLAEEVRLDLNLKPNPNLKAGTVFGRVTDSDGKQITNALVKIMDSSHNPLAHAFTGADGSYIFSPFPPGIDYHIYASAQGYKLAEGLPFTLLENQQVEKNFSMVVDPTAALGVIAGDIYKTTDGTPINGAAVNLYSVDDKGVETLISITFTNEFGQYVFSELAKANYIVRISSLGYKGSATTVKIDQDGQIAHVISKLDTDPQASRGTVSGIITDNQNAPIPDADVVLYKVETDGKLTPMAFTKTNDEGVYLFINVPQGDYKVKSNKSVSQ